jgi:hypothetical protein
MMGKHLETKDLISVGVFTAIYFVIAFGRWRRGRQLSAG